MRKVSHLQLPVLRAVLCISILFCAWPSPAPAEESESESDDFADLDLESLLASPVMEAASRRAESLDDAPISMSLITAEDIQAASVNNLAELLRLVPGAYVRQNQANNFELGMRGISKLMNNRVLLLIDGRQVTERLAGLQLWGGLPVGPGDIERIEIIRGPGSTFYGANAMSGVVNIITKRPIDHPGVDAEAWGILGMMTGLSDGADDFYRSGGGGRLSFAWANDERTFGLRLGASMMNQPEWPNTMDSVFQHGPFHYSVRLVADWRPDPDTMLFAALSHAHSEFLSVVDAGIMSAWNTLNQQAFTIRFERKNLGLKSLSLSAEVDGRRQHQDYLTERPGGSDYAPNSTQGTYASKEVHALAQINWSAFDDRSILSLGGEFTWFGVDEFFTKPWFVFGALLLNEELHLFEDRSLILHLGGRFEQMTAQEDRLYGKVVHRHFSPRAAVVYKPAEGHSLRLSFSSAYRTPAPYELFIDVSAQINDPPLPPHRFASGNPMLKPEEVWALELGYRARLLESLRLDAVVFGQQVRNVISPARGTVMPAYQDNLDDMDQLGLELGIDWAPWTRLHGSLNYTFVYSRTPGSGEWDKNWPAHLWNFRAELRLPWRSRLNLHAYLIFDHKPWVSVMTNTNEETPYFDRVQPQAADQAIINLRFGKFLFDDNAEVFVAVKNIVGFWREEQGLRMLPHQNMQPIGGTILIGLSARGF